MSNSSTLQALESLLFVSTKPITIKKLALQLGVSITDVRQAVEDLKNCYSDDRGISLIQHDDSVQFVTNPTQSEVVRSFLKEEQSGELTRSAIETLSIIAYRGPLAKEEIESIRGINCSIALRNLQIRGLIECRDTAHTHTALYSISFDFLKHLGVKSLKDLPDYDHFHSQVFNNSSETTSSTSNTIL